MPGAEMNLTLGHIWHLEREEKVLPFIQFSTFYISRKTASDPQAPRGLTLCGTSGAKSLDFSFSPALRSVPGVSRLLGPHSWASRGHATQGWPAARLWG